MIRRSSAARPTVSVAMCVYRPDPRFFPAAVESVLRQTFDDLELVIVEDPSEYCGKSMLADFYDPRIRYFANDRRTSLVKQRNRSLFEARGDLVAILDADDVAEPERLERQATFLARRPDIDLVGSHVAVIDERGTTTGYRRFPLENASLVSALHRMVPFCHPSVMFRKSAVLRAGGYQGNFSPLVEDYDLYSRLAWAGSQLANLPEPLTRYRLHAAQFKATHLRPTINGVLQIKRNYWMRTMDLQARLRMLAECALLCLPQVVVLSLLRKLYYRDAAPLVPTRVSGTPNAVSFAVSDTSPARVKVS